jgi:hypothetical protein
MAARFAKSWRNPDGATLIGDALKEQVAGVRGRVLYEFFILGRTI